jgi:hypothetical protein
LTPSLLVTRLLFFRTIAFILAPQSAADSPSLWSEDWSLAEEVSSWSFPFSSSLYDPLLEFVAGHLMDFAVRF